MIRRKVLETELEARTGKRLKEIGKKKKLVEAGNVGKIFKDNTGEELRDTERDTWWD